MKFSAVGFTCIDIYKNLNILYPTGNGVDLLFNLIEAVRRRPLDMAVQQWAFRAGFALLAALMLVVTINDLGSFGLWEKLAGLIG